MTDDNHGQAIADDISRESDERMGKSIAALGKDIATIRSNRASPAMVEHIQINYYGTSTPLQQLATISVPENRMLVITPYDKKVLGDIEKGLLKSDLNITPQNDGVVIRIILPELSLERRKELVKQLKSRVEEARISVRNIRRDSNEAIKKLSEKKFSKDQIKSAQAKMQKLTNDYISQIDGIAEKKEKEILNL